MESAQVCWKKLLADGTAGTDDEPPTLQTLEIAHQAIQLVDQRQDAPRMAGDNVPSSRRRDTATRALE